MSFEDDSREPDAIDSAAEFSALLRTRRSAEGACERSSASIERRRSMLSFSAMRAESACIEGS